MCFLRESVYLKKVMISAWFCSWHADEDLQSKGKNNPNVTLVTDFNQTWKVKPAHGMHCFKHHVTKCTVLTPE